MPDLRRGGMTAMGASRPTLQVDLLGLGLLGAGLPDWDRSQAVLREPASWMSAPAVLPPPARLPGAERRRSGAMVKLSLSVADQACAMAGDKVDPGRLNTVFASSSGDPVNTHAICETLATPDRLVSPTRFTNSVHNATAGYWHIGTQSRAASTSLCSFDASFAAGLLEAVSQCLSLVQPVLLVASDIAYPAPLHALRSMPDAFGLALLLAPPSSKPGAIRLRLEMVAAGSEAPSPCDGAGLEALRATVPAARGLPLLQAIARRQPGQLVIEGFDGLAVKLKMDLGDAP